MDIPSGDVTPARGAVPTRDEALARFERENASAHWGLAWRCGAILLALGATDWAGIAAAPTPAYFFAAVLFGSYLRELIPIAGRKRKQVRDLRPDTQLGVHDRESLLGLVRTVEQRLGVPADRYPVYLVRDKTLNAQALTLGLDSLLGRVDGVYLHRQTLHVLGPDELAFVVGHELGHCHRYYLRSTRWELLNLALVTVGGLAALRLVSGWGWLGVFGVGLFAAGLLTVLRGQTNRSIRNIEHLCDDYGAHAAGVVNAVNAMLKIAAESEAASRVARFCVEVGRQRKDIDPSDLMEEYERTVPFGSLERSEADRVLAASLDEVQRRNNKVSLRGLIEYLNDEEVDEEAVDELQALWRKLDAAPLVDWSKPLRETGADQLTAEQITRVVQALDANPKALLSRSPEELIVDSTHPSTRRRVQYLWKNRTAIEAAE